jgi:flagellar FliL protein
MTAADTAPEPPPKRSRLSLILGLVLGLAGAGGGFMATRLGLIALPGGEEEAAAESAPETGGSGVVDPTLQAASFIALDPLVVNVDDPSGQRFLRFVAQIEVVPGHEAEVEAIRPRFADVLNGYLRAVALDDLENPQALDLLRAQMLRRLQTVAGEGRVRDLLIAEFVLN